MALAIEKAVDVALPSEVGAWVQSIAEQALSQRATLVGNIESSARLSVPGAVLALTDLSAPTASPSGTPPPVPTEPTMLTASAEGDAPRRRSRRSIITLAAGAVVGVAAALLLTRLGQVTPVSRSAVAAAIPPEPPPSATASTAPSSAPANARAEGAAPDATPAPSAAPVASSAPQRAARPTPQPPPPARRPPASSCDPPYRIDESGRRIFKEECL
jgi:hypothetical protein